jgi:hypothetical protein
MSYRVTRGCGFVLLDVGRADDARQATDVGQATNIGTSTSVIETSQVCPKILTKWLFVCA